MRIGKMVPVFKTIIPIPQTFSTAFGLKEGSQLYLAPIGDTISKNPIHRFSSEIIVSSVPHSCWHSVCRLSVRIKNEPKALAKATEFLKENKINIILTEACVTYEDRAHWDAICDLEQSPFFAEIEKKESLLFEMQMKKALKNMTEALESFLGRSENEFAFVQGYGKHAEFSTLTGLNDCSFSCNFEKTHPLEFRAGGIELPFPLVKHISDQCGMESNLLPKYAVITGNTEQRYLRIFFLRDYKNIFRSVIQNQLVDVTSGGIGILQQFLDSMPEKINILKLSNFITKKENNQETGYIEIIGHWPLDEEFESDRDRKSFISNIFSETISSIEVIDIEGKEHGSVFNVKDFETPEYIYPRIFVSYPLGSDETKLKLLQNALWENDFDCVLGTDPGYCQQSYCQLTAFDSPDLNRRAFGAINTCVAFISLQMKRDDLRKAQEWPKAYFVSQWQVAEEAYAFASNMNILRIRDRDVDSPQYNKNILSFEFNEDDKASSFEICVREAIDELKRYCTTDSFRQKMQDSRRNFFKKRYLPSHHIY